MSPAAVYLLLVLATLACAWWFGWDHDRGGYAEPYAASSFRTQATAEHFVASILLTLGAAVLLGVEPALAALLTFAAGLGWELMQRFPRDKGAGYLSVVDLTADAAGCALAWGTLALLGRG